MLSRLTSPLSLASHECAEDSFVDSQAGEEGDLIAHDDLSRRVCERAHKLASSSATVLIQGDSGTGKEVLARYIHRHSGRRGAFVAVNCAALHETLAEAELFGHEAGAFTGAQRAREGWFEASNGGTLFLDEIGTLPLALQAKLLRVLQERQVVRIGSRRALSLDLRIVAATNVKLADAVRRGEFRLDLYYRLNIACIGIPPLHERANDILPLARHFLAHYRALNSRGSARLSHAAESALLAHRWPGNVRELQNVLHIAAIFASGDIVGPADLDLSQGAAVAGDADDGGVQSRSPIDELRSGLRRLLASDQPDVHELVESELLGAAYEHCDGNQVRTAKRLGISRNILRLGLKRIGLIGTQAD